MAELQASNAPVPPPPQDPQDSQEAQNPQLPAQPTPHIQGQQVEHLNWSHFKTRIFWKTRRRC